MGRHVHQYLHNGYIIHDRIYHVVESPKPIYDKPEINDDLRIEKKWEDNNLLAKATILSNMNDDLILVYEDYKNAREIVILLETKFGSRSNTYV